MGLTALPLTPARRTALMVLYDFWPTLAHYSNRTDAEAGDVYWQSADRLVSKGLAKLEQDSGTPGVRITAAGKRLAGEIRRPACGRVATVNAGLLALSRLAEFSSLARASAFGGAPGSRKTAERANKGPGGTWTLIPGPCRVGVVATR